MLNFEDMRDFEQRGSVLMIAIIVIAVLSIGAIAGWIFLSKKQTKPDNKSQVNLTNVAYKSQNPSLPPQYSQAKTASYSDKAQLDQISGLLNTYNISQIVEKSSNGCTGGTNYQYDLTYSDNSIVKYFTYKCANSFYGNMGGDVAGFVDSFEKQLKP
jgi:cytoskeletal protein RodZ